MNATITRMLVILAVLVASIAVLASPAMAQAEDNSIPFASFTDVPGGIVGWFGAERLVCRDFVTQDHECSSTDLVNAWNVMAYTRSLTTV